MKLLHLSELHLGKTVHEFSMLEDQAYILKTILAIADEEKPQLALISGDVFDRTVPPTEALRLFDDFLDGLVRRKIEALIISGNHDSPDRLSFGSRLMSRSGVHISPVYEGQIETLIRSDAYGQAAFYLLPFLKPAHVKRLFPDAEILTWSDALRTVIAHAEIDPGIRNVLLCHQFVTGAATCESEELSVGGADNVDADVFAPFDYVALGHLHGAQQVGRETLRYCGTPLKYSFSEVKHTKSLTVVELAEKGTISIREIPLIPKRDLRELRGNYLELTARDFYKALKREDYYRITLTDEEDQPDAVAKLRVLYPNLMRLDYDNQRTRSQRSLTGIADAGQYTPIELFDLLYQEQNGQTISPQQRGFLSELIAQIWGDVT